MLIKQHLNALFYFDPGTTAILTGAVAALTVVSTAFVKLGICGGLPPPSLMPKKLDDAGAAGSLGLLL